MKRIGLLALSQNGFESTKQAYTQEKQVFFLVTPLSFVVSVDIRIRRSEQGSVHLCRYDEPEAYHDEYLREVEVDCVVAS